jgi:hypothetical protein
VCRHDIGVFVGGGGGILIKSKCKIFVFISGFKYHIMKVECS